MTKSMLFANHRVVGTVLVAAFWSAVVQHASMQTPPTGVFSAVQNEIDGILANYVVPATTAPAPVLRR
jgi:hypothetical protein